MSKVLELCEGIELNVAYGMDPKYLTLTKIIRLQQLALEFYADRWTYYKRLKDGSREEDFYKFEMLDRDYEKIIEDWNGQTLSYNFSSPGKLARQTLEETNRIASGSEGGEK